MRRPELESALEGRCVAKIEAAGGMALKLRPMTGRGFPDRTVLLPDYDRWSTDRVFFIEFKRETVGVVSTQQSEWKRKLEALGFKVYLIDTDEQFDAAMKEWL